MGAADLDAAATVAERERRFRERQARRAGHAEPRSLAATRAGRALIAAVAVLALATAAGLVALWPHGAPPGGGPTAMGGPTEPATVKRAGIAPCAGPVPQTCRRLTVSVRGRPATLTLGPVTAAPHLRPGTSIRVRAVPRPEGTPAGPAFEPFTFVTVDRRGSIGWLALGVLAAAALVIRWRGLLAALGVGLSLLVVMRFVVPAILAGRPALLVALIGALAVMFVTLVLTSGLGAQTLAAALGIGGTLLLTSGLALAAVRLVHLDGHSSDLALALGQQDGRVSLEGVVLAGMVIGALGVLADTAVTQASAVMALRRADPGLSPRRLYRGAFAVGRDHLSATIHTLVLAYAGAALPLLLVLRSSGVGLADALNTQDVAEPVVATIVGCVGLVAAVPLTTGLAALLVARVPPTALRGAHAHPH